MKTTHILNALNKQNVLSAEQKLALDDLSRDGLTSEMLLNCNNGKHGFTDSHRKTLCKLVRERSFTVQNALKEIEELSVVQVNGIAMYSLTREDVIPFGGFNSEVAAYYIVTLGKLKIHGLTAEALLNFEASSAAEGGFQDEHSQVLCDLVIRKKFTLQDALREIKGLNWYQARGMVDGLTREDVSYLNNYWKIVALGNLKKHGLTKEMLAGFTDWYDEYGSNYCYALCRLVWDKHLAVQDALKEVEGLSLDQARNISEGRDKNQDTNYVTIGGVYFRSLGR